MLPAGRSVAGSALVAGHTARPSPLSNSYCYEIFLVPYGNAAFVTLGGRHLAEFGRAIEFHEYLMGLAGGCSDFDSWSVTFEDLASSSIATAPLKKSPFVNFGEGVLFRDLIERSLRGKSPNCVVDLGCGSGLPSLCAIQKLGLMTFWIGVDIDTEASAAADWNRMRLGIPGCVQQMNLDDFLSSVSFSQDTFVVANPPYIPTPPQLQRVADFRPVAAGPDGLRWIRTILNWAFVKNVGLRLVASSLTSPQLLLGLIEKTFRIKTLSIHRVRFGPYLKQEVVSTYLDELRKTNEGIL